jgi:hypothetical protein
MLDKNGLSNLDRFVEYQINALGRADVHMSYPTTREMNRILSVPRPILELDFMRLDGAIHAWVINRSMSTLLNILENARMLAAAAEVATDSAQREATFKAAYACYEAVLILAFTKHLQVNLLIVYFHAVRMRVMTQNLPQFYARMLPVVETALPFDDGKMWDAVEGYAGAAGIDTQAVQEALVQWQRQQGQRFRLIRPTVIPSEWLGTKTSVAEVEAKFTSEPPDEQWLHEWRSMIQSMRPGDELRRFSSSRESWIPFAGRAGYAVVRGFTVVDAIVTSMN